MIINTIKKKGFTLIEILIASTIFILVMGIITNFLFNSSAYSNRLNNKTNLANELRYANLRLEKEIEQCSSVLYSYTPTTSSYNGSTTNPITTNANRVILTRRVINRTTYMPVPIPTPTSPSTEGPSNTNIANYNDIVIIEYTGNTKLDGTAATTVQTGKLLISVIPAPSTNSDANYNKSAKIIKQTISASIINSSDDKVYTPLHPFRYFDYNSQEKALTNGASLTEANAKNVSMVVVNLFGSKTYSSYNVRQNTETKINLRNYSK